MRTFTHEQTYRLNLLSVQTLGLKVVSTHNDRYCGMYVGQSVVKTLSYGLCCVKIQWFKMIPKPLHLASLFVPENLWVRVGVLKEQITMKRYQSGLWLMAEQFLSHHFTVYNHLSFLCFSLENNSPMHGFFSVIYMLTDFVD